MASKQKVKRIKSQRRKARVRAKIFGVTSQPRLSVFRSLKHIYAQLIDDQKGKTLVAAKDSEVKTKKNGKTNIAFEVGELLAQKAKQAGIEKVVFDKGCYQYHGRIKSLADGARQGGLKF